jgi:Protein of unknown function (DUF3667)
MPKIDINTPIPEEPGLCRTCGAELTGTYCKECGEKMFVPGEHTVRHFLGDVLNAITFLDSKFLRTIKQMFRKPGDVSYQYINGRRVVFIKLMSMFFIVNLIYFLFPLYDSLNSSLNTQMNNLPHSAIATRMVESRIKEEKIKMETFRVMYDQQSTNMAKMCLVLLAFYFSVPLWLINYSKKLSFFDHITVSLEIWSLAILYVFILLGWIFYSIVLIGKAAGSDIGIILSDRYISWVSIVIMTILFYFFERNAYKQSIFRALTKAAILVLVFYVVLLLYRASLFFITMWTI